MNKYLVVGIIALLIGSGLSISAAPFEQSSEASISEHIDFSNLLLESDDETFVELSLSEASSRILEPGSPMLPVVVKKYVLPAGSSLSSLDVVFGSDVKITLDKKIMPAPTPVIVGDLSSDESSKVVENQQIYSSSEVFPEVRYEFSLHAGLVNGAHSTIVNLRLYPVVYDVSTDTALCAQSVDIDMDYVIPADSSALFTADEFDMVIITANRFVNDLDSFVDHKNSVGVRTFVKSVEDIYDEYDGVDKPEQIKYFIKDAIEQQGISYVLLMGGMKSTIFGIARDDENQGSRSWHVPVRYTNLYDGGSVYDPGYVSDLYYADIYKIDGNETVFDSWDSNDDGIFAKWITNFPSDKIDHYPDVYVGRLPVRSSLELKTVTNKIISYERSASGSSWFNRMIAIGGDSHDDAGTDFVEGEVVGDAALSIMADFTAVRLYASNRETDPDMVPNPEAIVREFSSGAGFVIFDGHGHPGSWNTHWPGEHDWGDTPGGVKSYDFMKMKNKDEYPIVLIGGCHNSQPNVTLLATALNKPMMWTHGMPVPWSFSYWLVRRANGGAIASFGSTGLGYGYTGNYSDVDGDGVDLPDTLEGLGGWTELEFFRVYDSGVDVLGEVWGQTIVNYLGIFPSMDDKIQMKSIQEWIMFGDPSLKIGGY